MSEGLDKLSNNFLTLAALYNNSERYWRAKAFQIACLLGLLPLISNATQMLPDFIAPWVALMISLSNVMVVVANVKLDIGERIADASMAGKGYAKLKTKIDMYTCKKEGGAMTDLTTLMVEITTTLDMIETNMSYPIALPAPSPSPANDSWSTPCGPRQNSFAGDVDSQKRFMSGPSMSRQVAPADDDVPSNVRCADEEIGHASKHIGDGSIAVQGTLNHLRATGGATGSAEVPGLAMLGTTCNSESASMRGLAVAAVAERKESQTSISSAPTTAASSNNLLAALQAGDPMPQTVGAGKSGKENSPPIDDSKHDILS
eukprot:gnl/TRDRNA2_/TRDRNA2_136431_c0_seq1.p1 gnl/TRDRNA2_/TRDRNA2_136431_c0~~gnl/TRDRNA2_/TRDRNA2_136431_c0_seq1.p1  ORF type:complete len:317 (+),score=40.87 gnl/TRDRNA2_/TRDRNA2_136431_c0_seq1:54-1004(+)